MLFVFVGLTSTFFQDLGNHFHRCECVSFSRAINLHTTSGRFSFSMLLVSLAVATGMQLLLRTKAKQAFFVGVWILCQPPLGGKKHAN